MDRYAIPDLLPQVLDILPVGVWIMDADGRIVYGNKAGHSIWAGAKYVDKQDYGSYKGWWRSSGEPIQPGEWAAARAIDKGETSIDEEIEIECFDGTRKIILNSAMPIRNADGAIIGGIIVNVDITARVAIEEKLRDLVEHDSLTGAGSRRKFFDQLNQEIHRAGRYGHVFSAIMFDLDHFKRVNDTLGHGAGDEVLAALSRRVFDNVRNTDHFCRLGGEEFIVILPETPLRRAAALAEKLRRTISATPLGPVARLTCSFGVREYNPGETPDDFLSRLDHALYRAKDLGRDKVVAD